VGVQPFGGHGLSGTGPKAGGPLYLARLVRGGWLPEMNLAPADPALAVWLGADVAAAARPLKPMDVKLQGPVGEENRYVTRPRGWGLCAASTQAALAGQVAACLATGNGVLLSDAAMRLLGPVPAPFAARVRRAGGGQRAAFVLFAGAEDAFAALRVEQAAAEGPIVPVHGADTRGRYPLAMLVAEVCVSVNLAAAGGDAKLMGRAS